MMSGHKPKRRRKEPIESQVSKVFGHPLRVEILQALQGRPDASPNELSQLLEQPLGNVAYHVSVLEEYGCVAETRSVQRRGAVEHYYRAVPGEASGRLSWRRLPKIARPGLAAAGLQRLMDQAIAAVECGAFETREEATLVPVAYTLDEAGWLQAAEIIEAASRQLETVANQSAERLRMTEQQPIPTLTALIMFEAARMDADEGGRSGG